MDAGGDAGRLLDPEHVKLDQIPRPDEVDRMLDKGFHSTVIRREAKPLQAAAANLLFSATFSDDIAPSLESCCATRWKSKRRAATRPQSR